MSGHSPEYVTALFGGENLNYDLVPIPEDAPDPPVTDFSQIQCLQVYSASEVFVAAGWQQNITAAAGETLSLPESVCRWLLFNYPLDWQAVEES